MSRAVPSFLAPLVKVGVFVLVAVLSIVLLGLTIANTSLQKGTTYRALFADVTALNRGDDVRIGGVRVGQVEGIGLNGDGQAEVTFSVAASRTLPFDTRATINYRNLVGQRYISLSRGAADTRRTLPPEATIPIAHTTPALNLTELFNGFRPLFRALKPEDVNKLSSEIIRVLQGEGGTVTSLLAHTASLTATLAKKDQVIGELIDNLNAVMGVVAARNSELSELLVTLQQFVAGLAEDRRPLGEAIGAVADLTQTTAGFLEDARAPLKQDIAELRSLATTLDENSDLVEEFLRLLPAKVAKINSTASYGSWFNFFLCSASGQIGLSSLGIEEQILPMPAAQQPARCRE